MTLNMIMLEGRIHFSINYPTLDHDSRMKIWRMFLRKTSNSLDRFSETDLQQLARVKINGRQV